MFDIAVQVYGLAGQRWAGLRHPRVQTARDLAGIVDGFGAPGPAMLRAAVARIRCQRWARRVIRRARLRITPSRPFTTPVGVVATVVGLDGRTCTPRAPATTTTWTCKRPASSPPTPRWFSPIPAPPRTCAGR